MKKFVFKHIQEEKSAKTEIQITYNQSEKRKVYKRLLVYILNQLTTSSTPLSSLFWRIFQLIVWMVCFTYDRVKDVVAAASITTIVVSVDSLM